MNVPPAIAALPEQATAMQQRLVRWASINSGSDHLAGLDHMAGSLAAALRELTPDVRRVPVAADGRVALHARLRPEAPRQILCSGHYDTVYSAGSTFQSCTPLADGVLRGPGVADMKGGIVVMLAALRAFEQTPHAHEVGWEIILTPDEEIGSAASRPLLEAAAPRAQLGLIFEPARETGDLVRSRMGTGIFLVRCHGRAAHAGRAPGDGRNAILALAEYVLALGRVPDELPGILLNVGRIHGGGTVNIVPDYAEAELNARCSAPAEASAFLARLHQLAAPFNARDGFRLEISGQFNRPPMAALPATEPGYAAWHQAAQELGLAPFGAVHVGGGSDGNLLQAVGLPCLDGLGPVGGHLHSAEEFVVLTSLVERAQVAALVLHRIAAGAIALPRRET